MFTKKKIKKNQQVHVLLKPKVFKYVQGERLAATMSTVWLLVSWNLSFYLLIYFNLVWTCVQFINTKNAQLQIQAIRLSTVLKVHLNENHPAPQL